MSTHGSANTFSSMERKTTQGNNNSSTMTSSAKKKKVSKHGSSNNSRNLKHSQSSVTLVNGTTAQSLQNGSDKKAKIPSQQVKKIVTKG